MSVRNVTHHFNCLIYFLIELLNLITCDYQLYMGFKLSCFYLILSWVCLIWFFFFLLLQLKNRSRIDDDQESDCEVVVFFSLLWFLLLHVFIFYVVPFLCMLHLVENMKLGWNRNCFENRRLYARVHNCGEYKQKKWLGTLPS